MSQPSATPTQKSSGKVAKLHRHEESGTVCALSSNGVDRYAVRNTADGGWSCTCPGFTHYGRCYHSRQAAARFPGFSARPAAVIVPATESEPEPPSPTASAIAHSKVCLLYVDPDCPACGSRRAA
jgi:hypothetical protein